LWGEKPHNGLGTEMADERVDVVIHDKISRSISPKLADIAKQARSAHSAVDKLNKAIGQLKTSALSKAANAATATQTATAKLATATQKLQQAQSNATAAASRASAAQARLGTATSGAAAAAARAQGAVARLAQQQTNAATAAIRHQQALQRLQTQQGRLLRVTGGGSGIGTGLVSVASLGLVLQTIDAYQRFQQRIDAVTDSQAQSAQVQQRLIDIANRTYASIDATATLYQRFAPAADRLGVSQNRLFQVIENLNKAMALSGATAGEARGALIQLSQAFSGNFRTSAQELNSLLEQAPALAKVLAQQLSTTPDQLKALAKAGRIAGIDLIKAFSDGGKGVEELKRRFSGLVPTLSQLGQQFANAFTVGLGRLAEASGLTYGLSTAITLGTGNLGLMFVAAAALFPFLLGGIASSTFAMGLFNAAVLRNPLIIGAALLAAAVTALINLSVATRGVTATFERLRLTVLSFAYSAVSAIYEVVSGINKLSGGRFEAAEQGWARLGLAIVKAGAASEATILAAEKNHSAQMAAGDGANNAAGAFGNAGGAADSLTGALDRMEGAGSRGASTLLDIANQARETGMTLELLKRQTELMNETYRSGQQTVQDMIKDLEFEVRIMGMNSTEQRVQEALRRAGTTATEEQRNAIRSLVEALEAEANASRRAASAQRDLNAARRSISASVSDGRGTPAGSTFSAQYNAEGGRIRGPGTATSDSILAWLSDGEYVVNARAAAKHRALLDIINNSPQVIAPNAKGYAEGGRVQWFREKGPGWGEGQPRTRSATGGVPGRPNWYVGANAATLYTIEYYQGKAGLTDRDVEAAGYRKIKVNGHPGYPNGTTMGFASGAIDTGLINAEMEQKRKIAEWQTGIKDWWQNTKETIDLTERTRTNPVVDKWIKDTTNFWQDQFKAMPNRAATNYSAASGGGFGVGPTTSTSPASGGNLLPRGPWNNPDYGVWGTKFNDTRQRIMNGVWTAAILDAAPAWADTIGKYLNYTGPEYGERGQGVTYGGDLQGAFAASQVPRGETAGNRRDNALEAYTRLLRTRGMAFRTGGSFDVGSGHDSKLVQFMANPDERITIRRPSDDRRDDTGRGMNLQMTVYANDANSFRESEEQIMSSLANRIRYAERNRQ
jgi:tape measure domain-containing protein